VKRETLWATAALLWAGIVVLCSFLVPRLLFSILVGGLIAYTAGELAVIIWPGSKL